MNYSILAPLHAFRAEGKIDFITTRAHRIFDSVTAAHAFQSAIRARACFAATYKGEKSEWVTIHDPFISDIQWLLDNHPEAPVQELETTVDFFLRDGSSDPVRLLGMFRRLKHSLLPQRHKALATSRRKKQYDSVDGKIKTIGMRDNGKATTVYWADNQSSVMQVRLYIKTHDNDEPLKTQHSVRLEVTMRRLGCQIEELHRIAELPDFVPNLRRYLSPAMYAAAGIKPTLKRTDRIRNDQRRGIAERKNRKAANKANRTWDRYGASWIARNSRAKLTPTDSTKYRVRRDIEVLPDVEMNAMIGSALKGLQEKLKMLKLTKKMAEKPDYNILESTVNKGEVNVASGVCIEATHFSSSITTKTKPRRFPA